jgi:hypothetical protein
VDDDPLGIDAAHDMPDRAVLATGVERLEHDEEPVGVLRSEALLVVREHLDSLVEQLRTVLLGEEIARVARVEIAREDDLRPGCNSVRRYQLPDLLQLVFGHDADTNLRFRSGKEKLRAEWRTWS